MNTKNMPVKSNASSIDSLFIAVDISAKERRAKILRIAIAPVCMCIALWFVQFQNGVLLYFGWFALLILIPLGLHCRKIWNQSTKVLPNGSWEVVPNSLRHKKAGATFVLFLLSVCGIWWALIEKNIFVAYWWYVWPLVIVGIALPIATLRHTKNWIPTEEAAIADKARKSKEAQDANAKFEVITSKWWVRYPFAGFFVWIALDRFERDKLWAGAIAIIISLAFAREIGKVAATLVAIALTVGAIWLLGSGVAAMPVSVAIIVGAIIIASSLRHD